MKNSKIIAMALAASMFFAACKKDSSSNEDLPFGATPPNTFNVKMTDGPGDYAGLNVQISKVEAYHETMGWLTLNSQTQIVDVLTLCNGAEMQLCNTGNVQAGVYSKLRITFGDENYLKLYAKVLVGGVEVISYNTVKLGWSGPKEVEIAIHEQVNAQVGASVVVDFNVAQSIFAGLQGYVCAPVIIALEDARYYTGIQGKVEGGAKASVMAIMNDDTTSTYANAKGEFLIRNMTPGTYKVVVEPAMCDTTLSQNIVVDGVVVVRGKITQMGTIN